MSERENTRQQPKTILTEFSNNITLITVGVLSVAYLNQLIYYSFFSIPIYNYIQVGELITLFVPALFNYLFQGLLPIAIIYFLLRAVNHLEKSKTVYNTNSNEEDSLGFTTTINSIKNIKSLYSINSLKGINVFRTIINFFQAIGKTIIIIIESTYKIMVLLFLVGCLFFIYKIFDDDKVLYSQNHSKDFFDGAGVQAVFCVTAILVVLEYLNIFFFKIPNNKFRLLSRYTLYLISPILFVIIINSVTTTNIKKGLAEYDVVFKYDGKQIQTDTNIVYVGATQNYLFLRERMTRKNYIYKIDKIDNLSMKKISYELGWKDWHK